MVPVVSILIPTFNRAATIERAIESGLLQDVAVPFEVVVVDNASDDGSSDLISAMAAEDSRIVYRRWSENLGPIENWRRGLDIARGDWIKVVWSDDWIVPTAVRLLLEAAQSHDCVVATCRAHISQPHGEFEDYDKEAFTYEANDVFRALSGLGRSLPWSPGAALVRRLDAISGLRALRTPEACVRAAIGPDVAMLYWGVVTGGQGVHVPAALAQFDGKHGSITIREGRHRVSACYDSTLMSLARAAGVEPPPDVVRAVKHRAALYGLRGVSSEMRFPDRRLSPPLLARSVARRIRRAVI